MWCIQWWLVACVHLQHKGPVIQIIYILFLSTFWVMWIVFIIRESRWRCNKDTFVSLLFLCAVAPMIVSVFDSQSISNSKLEYLFFVILLKPFNELWSDQWFDTSSWSCVVIAMRLLKPHGWWAVLPWELTKDTTITHPRGQGFFQFRIWPWSSYAIPLIPLKSCDSLIHP